MLPFIHDSATVVDDVQCFQYIVKIPIFQHIKALLEEFSDQNNSTNIR